MQQEKRRKKRRQGQTGKLIRKCMKRASRRGKNKNTACKNEYEEKEEEEEEKDEKTTLVDLADQGLAFSLG